MEIDNIGNMCGTCTHSKYPISDKSLRCTVGVKPGDALPLTDLPKVNEFDTCVKYLHYRRE